MSFIAFFAVDSTVGRLSLPSWRSILEHLSLPRKLLVVAVTLLMVVVAVPTPGAATDPISRPVTLAAFSGDQVMVKFAPGVDSDTATRIIDAHGGALIDTIGAIGVYVVALGPDVDGPETIRALEQRPDVMYAEANGTGGGVGYVPNDPGIQNNPGSQWHLWNVNAFEAWDLTRGSSDVHAVILDTGWESANAEFQGARFVPEGDVVTGDDDPEADHPHGVWTLHLMTGNADNNFSGAGIDHNMTAHIFKSLNANNGSTDAEFAAAIVAAANVTPTPDLMSLSLINYTDNQTGRAAIQYARDLGIIMIVCAGNGGIGDADINFPGKLSNVITIGATDVNNRRGHFSGTGSALDFVAPGVNVNGLNPDFAGGGFRSISGCSFATPIAAGIAGLMLSANPDLTQQDVYDAWQATARDQVGGPGDTPGRDDYYGHGLLDAAAAVAYVQAQATPEPPDPTPSRETITVDNGDPSTSQTGDWLVSGGEAPYGSNSLYCDADCTFTWTAQLPDAGIYDVFTWYTPHPNRTTEVAYTVSHAEARETVLVDQTQNAGTWVPLGSWSLPAGGADVTVTTANGQANADAVQFRRVNAAPNPEPPVDGLPATPAPPGSAAPLEVMHAVSCLGARGRVDTNVVNTTSVTATYRLEFDGLSARESVVAPNDFARIPITGRDDGAYVVRVLRDGQVISEEAIAVACDGDAPTMPDPEVQLVNSCRDNLGFLLFQFANPSAAERSYVIEFENVPNRSTSAGPYGAATRGVSGRSDGTWQVAIHVDGQPAYDFAVTVDCESA